MPRYVVRLRIETRDPLTREQLHLLDGDKHDTKLRGRLGGHDLRATLVMNSADPLGAVSRAANYVLDRIRGALTRIEAAVDEEE